MAVLASPCAQAADFYVDRGSIGGPCNDALPPSSVTSATPWCTPARAISAAPEGATVVLRAGTYQNIRALNVNRAQMLTLKPAPGETVTLQSLGTTMPEDRAIYLKGSRNLRFQGFQIVGGAYIWNSSFVQLAGNDITGVGVHFYNISDALVDANTFHDYTGSMRALTTASNVGAPGALRLTIRGNEFYKIEHAAIALYWRLQDITVEDNYIHDVHRPDGSSLHPDALQIAPQNEGAWGAIIVRRNRIVDFDQGILVKDGITRGLLLENNVVGPGDFFSVYLYDAPGARVINNTIGGRLHLTAGTTGAQVANNVMNRFAVDSPASVAVGAYNLVDRKQYNPGYKPSATDIDGLPSYVDAAGGDYRLTPGSLGIDAASPDNGAPVNDKDRNPRPAGGAWDMGAYEHQVNRPPPPPPPPPPAEVPAVGPPSVSPVDTPLPDTASLDAGTAIIPNELLDELPAKLAAVPGPKASLDSTPPVVTLSGKRSQRLGRIITVDVRCDENCLAIATGTLALSNTPKRYKINRTAKVIAAHAKGRLRLRLSNAARKAVVRAVTRRRASATITAVVTDKSGNRATVRRQVGLIR